MDAVHPPMSSADVMIDCMPTGHPALFIMQEASRCGTKCTGWPASQKLEHSSPLHGSWLYDLREVITSWSLSFFVCKI